MPPFKPSPAVLSATQALTRTAARSPGAAWPVLLFALLVLASSRMLLNTLFRGHLESLESPLYYHAGTLAFNYFEMGAVRRGLGGSMVYLLADNPLLGTALFHWVWAAAVAVPFTWLVLRVDGPWHRRMAFALVALFIMNRWGEDAGRIDIAVAALLGGAALAVLQRRLAWAAAAVGVGLFIHEASFIYGVPLLAALVWRMGGGSAFDARSRHAALAVLAAALGLYGVLPLLPHAAPQTMVEIVQAKFPPRNVHVNLAIYFAVSGVRGVQASICQNRVDPTYWAHPLGGLIVLAACYLALAGEAKREWPAVLLAALPPLVFLSGVANDVARWTNLAAFNAWLVLAATPMPRRQTEGLVFLSGACALAFLVLTNPLLIRVKYPIYTGSPLVQKVVDRLTGTTTLSPTGALRRCDPAWHEVLGLPPSRQ